MLFGDEVMGLSPSSDVTAQSVISVLANYHPHGWRMHRLLYYNTILLCNALPAGDSRPSPGRDASSESVVLHYFILTK